MVWSEWPAPFSTAFFQWWVLAVLIIGAVQGIVYIGYGKEMIKRGVMGTALVFTSILLGALLYFSGYWE